MAYNGYYPHNDEPKVTLNPNDAKKAVMTAENSEGVMANIIEDLPSNEGVLRFDSCFNRSDISIPSPWSLVISMDTMLFGKDLGEFQTMAENEWKALLALIALKPLMGTDLEIKKISLNDNSLRPQEKAFYNTLLGLRPVNYIFDGDCWNNIYYIKLNGKIIGILSDSTLVCSAYVSADAELKAYLEGKGGVGLVIYDAGKGSYLLNDPSVYIAENEIRCSYMVNWLKAVRESLTYLAAANDRHKYRNALITRLEAFENEIIEAFNNNPRYNDRYDQRDLINQNFVRVAHNAQGKTISDAFVLFDLITVEFDFTIPYLSVMLKAEDSNMYIAERLTAELKNLFDNDDFMRSASKIKIRRPENMPLLTAKDIFADKLTLVYWVNWDNKYEAAPLSRHLTRIGLKTITLDGNIDIQTDCFALWPIKSNILDKAVLGETDSYTLKEKRMQLIEVIDGTYRVKIEFNFKGEDKPYEMTRIYSEAENEVVLIDAGQLPYLSVWPYAKVLDTNNRSTWNEYYVFRSQKGTSPLGIELDRNVNCLKHSELTLLNNGNAEELKRSVSKYDGLASYAAIKNKSGEEIGLILFNRPEYISKGAGASCLLGLDFGTTSTTLFARKIPTTVTDAAQKGKMRDNEEAEFVRFGNAFNYDENNLTKKKLTDTAFDIRREEIIQPAGTQREGDDYFLPNMFYDRFGYPSIYQVCSDSTSTDFYDEILLTGNVLFDYNSTEGESLKTIVDNNLKWSDDPQIVYHLKGYLGQMLKMAAFRLAVKNSVDTVTLRASYPTSLPRKNLNNFRSTLDDVIRAINASDLGVKFITDKNYTYYTESIVAAKLHSNRASNLYACVDIGGGSTDISVWMKETSTASVPSNLFQVSVNVASRKIFLPALSEVILKSGDDPSRPSQLQENIVALRPGEYGNALSSALKEMQYAPEKAVEKFGLKMESAIFQYSDRIQKTVMSGTVVSKDAKYKYERKLATGLFALFYYALRSLAVEKRKHPDIYKTSAVSTFNIFLAGNGAKIYSWIKPLIMENMESVLTKMAVEADLIVQNGRVVINPPVWDELKTEAARGLTIMDVDTSAGSSNVRAYNGEKITFILNDGSERVCDADYDIEADENIKAFYTPSVTDTTDIASYEYDMTDFKYLKRFISVLNEEVFENDEDYMVRLPDDNYNSIYELLLQISDKKRTIGLMTPSFIDCIEALLMYI